MFGLVGLLFGCCSHKNYSFPMSFNATHHDALASTKTYVVCLECGREFPYDWEQMQVMDGKHSRGFVAYSPAIS